MMIRRIQAIQFRNSNLVASEISEIIKIGPLSIFKKKNYESHLRDLQKQFPSHLRMTVVTAILGGFKFSCSRAKHHHNVDLLFKDILSGY